MTHLPSCFPSYFSSGFSASIVVINTTLVHVQTMNFDNSIFVNFSFERRNFILGSQYSAPSKDLEHDLKQWSDYFPETDNLIIGGDFNSHLTSWGYSHSDDWGEILLDYIALNDLTILNDPEVPYTYREGNKIGTPDFTLGGINVLEFLDSWLVLDTINSDSDHLFVYFTLNLKSLENKNFRYKTLNSSFKRFNNIFKDHIPNMDSCLDNVENVKDLDDFVNNFQNLIQTTMETCFKKRKLRFTPKLTWYTEELKIKRNRLNAIYKRSIRFPDNLHYRVTYKKKRAIYKKEVKKQKKRNWLKFCENTSDTFGKTFKIARSKNLKTLT